MMKELPTPLWCLLRVCVYVCLQVHIHMGFRVKKKIFNNFEKMDWKTCKFCFIGRIAHLLCQIKVVDKAVGLLRITDIDCIWLRAARMGAAWFSFGDYF